MSQSPYNCGNVNAPQGEDNVDGIDTLRFRIAERLSALRGRQQPDWNVFESRMNVKDVHDEAFYYDASRGCN